MDSHGSCVIDKSAQTEGAILGLLLDFEAGSLWSEEELVRTLSGSRVEVLDGLANLHAAGLIHRCGGFVFATRAASSFDRIDI
jgi:hypothetical protein